MTLRDPADEVHQVDLQMMQICLELAEEAARVGEVPVGALVVHDGNILARAYNLCEHHQDPTAHAERLALTAAGRAHQSWRLTDCTLYATLEPCCMCAGAIVQARISRLVYGAEDPAAGACRSLYRLTQDPRCNHQVELTSGILRESCTEVLLRFFQQRR